MSSNLILGKDDNGKTVELSVGQSFLIQLNENPTTGYQWEVSKIDADFVKLTEDQYIQNIDSETGGGGIRNFKFTANSTGEYQIQLVHQCSWRRDESSITYFKIKLRIC
ncbi:MULTISPECIES: protease inhibitor I42 family protein [Calothrix]|uniref:Protease inhibitor I42 family protein n=2 Tax=Calothrix TaxID=1186 RepID=A0ABR8A565_9CYAN|nr:MULTISPECIES: protease inhibitor I42 family protein [Calothrix]MBD2194620.1 protease inhibitor I42 family protein [Calothrix parietina FACHB-288]MBD2223274.1 protease inhibitor I42 family protein [Calothrix anomala FACHB-343]